MTDQPRISAVVVTFNRLPLLQRLLERLDAVPGLAEVIVVDNASTDGTGEWLATLADREAGDAHPEVPVIARTLATNSGGAGGFHDGLELAYERGADLVWLMDDDGLPEPDCLERLLAYAGRLDFWGPAVVDEGDPDRLTFPIRLPGGSRVVHDLASVERATDADGLIRDIVIPFNGVLVTRELVERIGYPRAEFFIWGDDHEYRLRAEAAGARIATVTGARVLHPAIGELGTPMAFGRTTYNHTPSDLKHYCMARNNLVNLRDYKGWPHALAFVAKTIWFYLLTRRDPARLRLSAQAWWAAVRGDFTGHRRFLGAGAGGPETAAGTPSSTTGRTVRSTTTGAARESVAIVVVTYNRADMLERMLAGLGRMHRPADAVIVVDNASTDRTPEVLEAWAAGDGTAGGKRVVVRSEENLGGAGGFHRGVREAYDAGFDRIWLMDDDVIPAPDCLEVLLGLDEPCLTTVREDLAGHLVEKAAVRFDLRNPLAIRPKTAMVETEYASREAMPAEVPVENVAFEGFMVRREVVERIGLPDPSYFIFYDDVDYAVRARRAGYTIWAVRDAVLVRQLDFSQQHDLSSWKGFYMYRNLFAVHFRYGENPAVRLKPYAIAAAVTVVSAARGRWGEIRNVNRALLSARAMRTSPSSSVD